MLRSASFVGAPITPHLDCDWGRPRPRHTPVGCDSGRPGLSHTQIGCDWGRPGPCRNPIQASHPQSAVRGACRKCSLCRRKLNDEREARIWGWRLRLCVLSRGRMSKISKRSVCNVLWHISVGLNVSESFVHTGAPPQIELLCFGSYLPVFAEFVPGMAVAPSCLSVRGLFCRAHGKLPLVVAITLCVADSNTSIQLRAFDNVLTTSQKIVQTKGRLTWSNTPYPQP
jgi:hypothetical protein